MIDDDKPSIAERLHRSFSGTDLSVSAEHRTDADYLMALGMAGQRVDGVSGAVVRLSMSGSRMEYRAARESVVRLVRGLNAKRHWRLSGLAVRAVGELALAHHAFPRCPVCEGRGRERPEGAPYLSGAICKPCHGTGKRPIQRRHHDEIRAVLEVLERCESLTEGHVRKLLR